MKPGETDASPLRIRPAVSNAEPRSQFHEHSYDRQMRCATPADSAAGPLKARIEIAEGR